LDCDNTDIWEDPIDLDPLIASFLIGETVTVTIPLPLKMESAFGANICGQRIAQVSPLPSFCTLSGADLTCAPVANGDEGTYELEVT